MLKRRHYLIYHTTRSASKCIVGWTTAHFTVKKSKHEGRRGHSQHSQYKTDDVASTSGEKKFLLSADASFLNEYSQLEFECLTIEKGQALNRQ